MESRVYRNLNNGLWSIKQRVGGQWQVVGHCSACVLLGASPYISAKRHAAVQDGHREVFAWLSGDVADVVGFVSFKGRQLSQSNATAADLSSRITFHPKGDSMRGFHYVESGAPFIGGNVRFTTTAVYAA